jgi:hypothetical protein
MISLQETSESRLRNGGLLVVKGCFAPGSPNDPNTPKRRGRVSASGIRLAAVGGIAALGRKTPDKLEGLYISRLTSARVGRRPARS